MTGVKLRSTSRRGLGWRNGMNLFPRRRIIMSQNMATKSNTIRLTPRRRPFCIAPAVSGSSGPRALSQAVSSVRTPRPRGTGRSTTETVHVRRRSFTGSKAKAAEPGCQNTPARGNRPPSGARAGRARHPSGLSRHRVLPQGRTAEISHFHFPLTTIADNAINAEIAVHGEWRWISIGRNSTSSAAS
jgi:hypothetical protein